jgi:aspartate/methionine/tyrosine aminotransferase
MKEICSSSTVPSWVFDYVPNRGNLEFRRALASMMETTWVQAPVEAEFIGCQAGAGSILDLMAWCLCEPGEAMLTPNPLYSGFLSDFSIRGGVTTEVIVTSPDRLYIPTKEELEAAYQKSAEAGHQPRVLLLCNPNNPTGVIYTKETIEMCIDWANSK